MDPIRTRAALARARFWIALAEADLGPRESKVMSNARYGALGAVIGTAAAGILMPIILGWEGTRPVPYKDVVGIWTVCTGDTHNVEPGKTYSKAECEARLEKQLIAHAKPVMECAPGLTKDHPNQLAASVSLAYNIGPNAFCRSTVAKRFNRGDWRGGCDAFLLWDRAGGRRVAGLTNRRKAERKICLRGL